MAMNTPPVLHTRERSHEPLPGAGLQALCGLAWLGVAWAFSFLDRARGGFAVFAVLWLVVGLLGFGLGVRHRAHPQRARRPALLLTVCACALALFPGFLMFVLVRWAAFALLLVTAARAAAMHTRRDLYYALAAVVAVSLLVLTHPNAQWTVWFYLGPAWLCIVLALAWDYAADVRLRAPVKAGLSVGFVAACMALGAVLSTLWPLPGGSGFGFLDPPTASPRPAGNDAGTGGTRSGAGGDGDAASGAAGGPSSLGDVIDALQRALADRGLPRWQHQLVEGLLGAAEALGRATGSTDLRVLGRPATPAEVEAAHRRAQALQSLLDTLLLLLALLLASWLLWRLRWRIGGATALAGAALLGAWAPGASMRCSMLALHCLLHRRGQPRGAGHSILEHVASARFLQAPLRRWLQQAVHTYGAWRFGGGQVTRAQARDVRRAVVAADELLRKEARA